MYLLTTKFNIDLENDSLLSKQKRMLFFAILAGLAGIVIGVIVIVFTILHL